MAYPPYPSTPPAPPTQPAPQPYWPYPYPPPYGYGPPRTQATALVTVGAILASLGSAIIGVGWLLPSDAWTVVVGIGYLLLGPGLGMALIGMSQRPAMA